jgi:hypothetical protein
MGGYGRGFNSRGNGNKDDKEQPLVLCVPIANSQHLKITPSTTTNNNSSSNNTKEILGIPNNDKSHDKKTTNNPSEQVALVRKIPSSLSSSIEKRTANENMQDLFHPFDDDSNQQQVNWHRIGCVARIVRIQRVLAPTITYTIILQGKYN